MLLVDTNVLVALFVRNTPWFESARALHKRDPVWRSESHALVELSNVFTRYVRVGEFDIRDASDVLGSAEQMLSAGLVTVSHVAAMQVALACKVSAYDARFLVAAQHFGSALVTEDARLRRAAPELTQSIDEALAAA